MGDPIITELDDLDKDPFGEKEEVVREEELISEKMVKKITYLIHKLAERRGQDFKDIQKKCKKMFAYNNLAKISMEEGHRIIDKLVEVTGGEEKEKEQLGVRASEAKPEPTTKPDEGFRRSTVNAEPKEEEELEKELGHLSHMLQICVHDSKDIFELEFGEENITEGNRAMLVKSFAATIFIEAGKRGIGR